MKIDLTEARVQVSGVLTQRKKIVKPTMNWSALFPVNSNIHKFYLLNIQETGDLFLQIHSL